jgi:hypothetical protein
MRWPGKATDDDVHHRRLRQLEKRAVSRAGRVAEIEPRDGNINCWLKEASRMPAMVKE